MSIPPGNPIAGDPDSGKMTFRDKRIGAFYDDSIESLVGKVVTDVAVSEDKERIEFTTADGTKYVMLHIQDCCESVSVEDVCGDWGDIIGEEVISATEDTQEGDVDGGTQTWTFYNITTRKGRVTIRWYGTSNGYYCERVTVARLAESL